MSKLQGVETRKLRQDLPPFRTGDTVRVHVRVREGDKERIQVFEGLVIRRKGDGVSASFTVRKIYYGVGVEWIFPVESPAVEKVEIKGRGHVRRSRLYYLRELHGKKARLRSKVRDLSGLISPEEAAAIGTADAAARAAEIAAAEPAEVAAEVVNDAAAEFSQAGGPVDEGSEEIPT